ncbi:MAG: hypothetical protein U0169_17525 [Polyangiaceae bacterium]
MKNVTHLAEPSPTRESSQGSLPEGARTGTDAKRSRGTRDTSSIEPEATFEADDLYDNVACTD